MKIKKKNIAPIACIAAVYIAFAALGIGCPIKFITGISCGGCGMTRAWYSVMHLNFSDAFAYHPLFWIIPLVTVTLIFRDKMNEKVYKTILAAAVIAMTVVYVIRMFTPADTVVTFDITDGIVWKTIKFIIGGLKNG